MKTAEPIPGRIVALFCLLPFLGFWTYGLFDLDEGFYAAVVSDMMRRGDFITPTFNGVPWFEKPILAYWTAIPAVAIFGENLGPRLPSVVATLATIWLLYRFARGQWGEFAGQLAAAGYAGCLLVVAIGRMMLTDALLVLCLVGAFVSFWESLQGKPGHRLWTGVWLGLGVLAKGPVALILFGVPFIWIVLAEPTLRPGLRGGWPQGLAALAAVIAAWYVPCYLVNGEVFVQKFLIEQNIGRFTGGDLAHRLPNWAWWAHPVFYPVVLLVGMGPWLVWGVRGIPRRGSGDPLRRVLTAWALGPIVLFSLSGSKLPHYILPAVPGLVLVAAAWLAPQAGPRLLRGALGWLGGAALLANVGFLYAYYGDQHMGYPEAHAVARWSRGQTLVTFRLGRQAEGPPELGLERAETSLPSIAFYHRAPVVKTDSPDALADHVGALVLSRAGAVSAEDFDSLRELGLELEPVEAPFSLRRYTLQRVGRTDGP